MKMLINPEPQHILARKMTKKKKIYISHAWIVTTVCQAVGLQESVLDHTATTSNIPEQLTYISFTRAHQIEIA